MTREEILGDVNKIFHGVLGDTRIELTPATTAKDVVGWDSLTHTLLIAKVQEHFKIKFGLREVMSMQNVGDMIALIAKKLG
jgi:acyl carrier protein